MCLYNNDNEIEFEKCEILQGICYVVAAAEWQGGKTRWRQYFN